MKTPVKRAAAAKKIAADTSRDLIPVEVPIPNRPASPFKDMEVGQAFVVPASQENSIRSNASRWKKRLGHEFTVKRLTPKEAEFFGKQGTGWIGVWRVS